ncbi:MAG: CvpA family protein, partial [Oscillospiraceae bacterium]
VMLQTSRTAFAAGAAPDDVAAMAVIIVFAISGSKKGFARSALNLLGYVISMMGAYYISKKAAVIFYAVAVKGSVIKMLTKTINSSETAFELSKIWDEVPPFLSKLIENYSNGASLSSLTQNSLTDIVSTIEQTVIAPIIIVFIQIIFFIIVFAVLSFLTKHLSKIIGAAFKMPVINTFNSIAGLIFGVLSALIILYVAVSVIHLVIMLTGGFEPYLTKSVLNQTFLVRYFNLINEKLSDGTVLAIAQKLFAMI